MLQWCDDFGGYGTGAGGAARLLDGSYTENGACSLVADPDPSTGGTPCLKLSAAGNSGLTRQLSAPRTTIGVAARYRLDDFSADRDQKPILAYFSDAAGHAHLYVMVDPTGYIEAWRHDAAGDVLIGQSSSPVLIADAWRHVETKAVLDADAGSIEVRVQGISAIARDGIRTVSDVVGAVASASKAALRNLGSGSAHLFAKDLIVWDGSGAANKDFMGSRARVLRVAPDADVELNWTPSEGDSGADLIAQATPADDGAFIFATATGDTSTFSLADLPPTASNVRGVMAVARSRKVPLTDGDGSGSIVTDPNPDFMLLEFALDEMRYPKVGFSAYLEAPFDALDAIDLAGDALPLQGVALEGSPASDYVEGAILAFPPSDGTTLDVVDEEVKHFSLLVDLRSFDTETVIQIGLYGYVEVYYIDGGDGTDGPFFGEVDHSTLYGTLSRHFDLIDPKTPAGLLGADRYLKLKSAFDPDGYDLLVSSFPELTGIEHSYSVSGAGQFWGYLWSWHSDDVEWRDITPGTLIPDNDPNAFIIYPPNNAHTFTYWPGHDGEAGFEKTGQNAGGLGSLSITIGPAPTLNNQLEVPTPPPSGKTTANIQGSDNVTYYLPTWQFANDRSAPVKGFPIFETNPFHEIAEYDYAGPARSSRTWETPGYPDRPEFGDMGTITVPSQAEPSLDDQLPSLHFGHLRIGTLTIGIATGEITFTPELPPIAGDGSLQVSLISGASTGTGTDRALDTDYAYGTDIFETDPQGAGAWTPSRVNALQLQLSRTE